MPVSSISEDMDLSGVWLSRTQSQGHTVRGGDCELTSLVGGSKDAEEGIRLKSLCKKIIRYLYVLMAENLEGNAEEFDLTLQETITTCLKKTIKHRTWVVRIGRDYQ